MKLFWKLLLFVLAVGAALVGLSLLDQEKHERYVSVYDTDDEIPY